MPRQYAKLEVDSSSLAKALLKAPKQLRTKMKTGLRNIGAQFEAKMEDRLSVSLQGPWKRNPGKKGVASRTGNLARSMRSRVLGSTLDTMFLLVTIGDASAAAYALIQEKGGTIRPKRSKYLTIPAPANLTGAGLARFPSARQTPGPLFVYKTKGTLTLARALDDGSVQVMWLLKREVKIKPRLGFRKTWNTRDMQRIRVDQINKAVARALDKAGLA